MLNINDTVKIIKRDDYEDTLTNKYFSFNDSMITLAEREIEGTVLDVSQEGHEISVSFEYNGTEYLYHFHSSDLVVTQKVTENDCEEHFAIGDLVLVKQRSNYEKTETNRLYSFEPEMVKMAEHEAVGEIKEVSFGIPTKVDVIFKNSPRGSAWAFHPSDLKHVENDTIGDMTKEELRKYILETIQEKLNE